MQCPGCASVDLDPCARCPCCGLQLTVAAEQRLKAAMPAPRTRRYQENLEDFALREA